MELVCSVVACFWILASFIRVYCKWPKCPLPFLFYTYAFITFVYFIFYVFVFFPLNLCQCNAYLMLGFSLLPLATSLLLQPCLCTFFLP